MSLDKNTKKDFGAVKIWNERGLDMSNNKIRNVADPVLNSDGVNKLYVDTKFGGVGDIKWSVNNSDHYGWLLCDGRSISRAGYPELFALIGTSFGSIDGNSFNLPNCKGRVLGGIGQGTGLTNRTLGQTVGEETHIMTTAEMPTHTHTGTTDSSGTHSHSITDPGHTHTQSTVNDDYNNSGGNPPGFTGDSAGTQTWSNINTSTTGITVNSDGAHTHTFTSNAAGSGNAFNVMQPTLFIGNVFIFGGIMGV